MQLLSPPTYRNSIPILLITLLVAATLLLLMTPYYWLAAALPIVCIVLFFLIKNTHWGLYGMVALIPFGAFRKIYIGQFELNVPWILAAIVLVVLILQFLLRQRSWLVLKDRIWVWLLLFLGVMSLSAFYSIYKETPIADIKLWMAALLFIALCFVLISPHGLHHHLPKILIFSVFVSAQLGVIGFFFGIDLFAREQISGTFSRGLGGAIDANNMALMVIATLPLVVHCWLTSQTMRHRLLYLTIFMLNLVAVGTTYSRGGFLVLLLSLLLMLWEFRRFNKPKYLGFFLFVLCAASVSFVHMMPDSFWERQTSLVSWSDSSLTRRTSYLFVAQDAFVEHPFIGSGPGAFREIFKDSIYARVDDETGEAKPRYAHNTYLEVLVGTGALGMLIFLMILYLTLRGFSIAKQRYLSQGNTHLASLMGAYKLYFMLIMLYLLIFSEPFHKLMLLAFALSPLALRFAKASSQDVDSHDAAH